jgi:hypothetical protein
MYIDTTTAATKEKGENIVANEYFVGVRVFDARRFGMLLYKYSKSQAWSLPMIQRTDSSHSMMDLMFQVVDGLPVVGPRKLISAVTLMESTALRPLQNDEYVQWNMFVYGVRLVGRIRPHLPKPGSKFDEARFVPFEQMGTKVKPFNEITQRFFRAMEKQTCLR